MKRTKSRQAWLCKRLLSASIQRLRANVSKALQKKKTNPALICACAFIKLFHNSDLGNNRSDCFVIDVDDSEDDMGFLPVHDARGVAGLFSSEAAPFFFRWLTDASNASVC